MWYYLCMRITKVTDNSFYYYLLADINTNTIPNVRAISSTTNPTDARNLPTCTFCQDRTSDASFLRRSTVTSVPPVTAVPVCLPCTKTQAECDATTVAPAVTSMATSTSSPTVASVTDRVLPIATSSQVSRQAVAGVANVAGASDSGFIFVDTIVLFAAIVGIQAIVNYFSSVEPGYELVQFVDSTV
ncbi:uncharacterized protein LOC127700679 [Mytilus californianus]|uniref:uncharacterized protein LOC127700679 n=1 Tax=Mytilus californianus TaxID=6549 RepID=UPI002247942E|nr:uncharacterized protein LOC127700679 [Mytilus californianus]